VIDALPLSTPHTPLSLHAACESWNERLADVRRYDSAPHTTHASSNCSISRLFA
jgi:hypothetical protein